MKIYHKVFFSIINDLNFLKEFDLNNSKNKINGDVLNWLVSNFVNILHDNKIYISEVTSTPINIQNENIYFYLEISTKKLKVNEKIYFCFHKNHANINKSNFKKETIFIVEAEKNEILIDSSKYFFKIPNGKKNLIALCD